MASAEAVAKQTAGHLEKAVGQQKSRGQVTRLGVIQTEILFDLRQPVRKAQPLDVGQNRQTASGRQHQ